MHPREKAAAKVIYEAEHPIESKFTSPKWSQIQDSLRFRFDNLNEKALYVSTEFDPNGVENPRLSSNILSQLAQLNFKYHVSNDYEEMCELIRRTENLAHVIISGHGNVESILFNKFKRRDILSGESNLDCFSGMQSNGRIVLISCSTGGAQSGRPFDNIAQKMVDAMERTVNVPIDLVAPSLTKLF